ncbi:MAG: caspase family protein [Algicola sp.]|nr:caspase family protein [Algicola sp.]
MIDACREGVDLSLTPVGDKSVRQVQERTISQDDRPTIVMIYACQAQQLSHWGKINNHTTASWFTWSLCQVLKTTGANPPATLAAIIQATQPILDNLASNQGKIQQITMSEAIVGRGGEANDLLLREDAAQSIYAQIKQSKWCCELKTLAMFHSTFAISESTQQEQALPPIAIQLLVIVQTCEQVIADRYRSAEEVSWRPTVAPFNHLKRLNLLVNNLQPNLTDSETALTLAAPFIYEALLAQLEMVLADKILSCETAQIFDVIEQSWLSFVKSQEAVTRQAKLLDKRGQAKDAEAVRRQLLYPFAHQVGELWEFAPDGADNALGWFNTQLQDWLKPMVFLLGEQEHLVTQTLCSVALTELVRLMHASPAELARYLRNEAHSVRLDVIEGGEGAEQWRCSPMKVLPLLSLSANMALDPRRLHPAVAEHIGQVPDFTMDQVHQLVEKVSWLTGSQSESNAVQFSLCLTCPHQVLDFAFEQAIKDLNAINQNLVTFSEGQLWRTLVFDDKNLVPILTGGLAHYSRPHIRFGVDERKTMELLMGHQLYGDPNLALRELYQNALDACRYRQAREEYQRKIGEMSVKTPTYRGEISFISGYEPETNRQYIECCDNGIGMAKSHLLQLFARGGNRFSDSHEFQLERAAWAIEDIPFYPNSRFGVGVLSYFMLADQIEITTSRLKPTAKLRGPVLKASIQGSYSIFRVRQIEEDGDIEYGTTIRLYLRNENTDVDELLLSINDWLGIPEFDTIVTESDGEADAFLAGRYYGQNRHDSQLTRIPIKSMIRHNGQARIFWAWRSSSYDPKIECYRDVLVDGIRVSTGQKEEKQTHSNYIFDGYDGLICNLTDDWNAELSVDRKQLMNWESIRPFILQQIKIEGWQALPLASPVDLLGLSALIQKHPVSLNELDIALTRGQVPMTAHINDGQPFDLKNIGISPLDVILCNSKSLEVKSDKLLKLESAFRERLVVLNQIAAPLTWGLTQLANYDNNKSFKRIGAGSLGLIVTYGSLDSLDDLLNLKSALNEPLQTIVKLTESLAKAGCIDFDAEHLAKIASGVITADSIEIFSKYEDYCLYFHDFISAVERHGDSLENLAESLYILIDHQFIWLSTQQIEATLENTLPAYSLDLLHSLQMSDERNGPQFSDTT